MKNTDFVSDITEFRLKDFNELHGLTEEQEGFFCCQDDLLVIISINIFKCSIIPSIHLAN